MNLERKKQIRADLMLLLVTFAWGISYILVDFSMTDLGPMTLNAHRFIIAFIVAGGLGFNKLRHATKKTVYYSICVGSALAMVYICVTYGMKHTTISNAGFLCAMTVLFTPLLAGVFLKQKQELKVKISVTLSIIGIALLTLNEDFSINMTHIIGDILCLGCAFFYSIDLLLTEKAVADKSVDAFSLGVFQLGVSGVEFLIMSFIFESPHLPTTGEIWASTLFLAVFCTGLAFIVQPIAQKYTTAAHTGIVFTLEPIFNAVAAFFILNEIMSIRAYLGGAIMILAILCMELNLPFLKKNND